MKVLVLFTYEISLKIWDNSGLFDRETKLYKEISKNSDVTYTFLTFGDKKDIEYRNNLVNIEIIPIYDYINKSSLRVVNIIKSFFVPLLLKKVFVESDILKSNQLNGSWILLIAKLLYKKPIYIRTGFNLYEFAQKNKKGIFQKLFYLNLTRFALKHSDLYSVTSQKDKDNLINLFPKINKEIAVRPNWVAIDRYSNLENRFEKKLLCVGRLEKQKNFPALFKVMENLNLELDIIGDGTQKEELSKLKDKLGLSVNFISPMTNSELLSFYKKYKFFILSSKFEGNPKVLLEAMGAGCIVIGNNIDSIKEIITNKKDGFIFDFEVGTSNHFIDIIDEKFKTLQLISETAHKKILDNNSFDNYLDNEKNDYNVLIKSLA
jgi:glycosyltransferase involved in cell wall biosynthesis